MQDEDDNDGWVFDTVKPPAPATIKGAPDISEDVDAETQHHVDLEAQEVHNQPSETMMENLHISPPNTPTKNPNTMRRRTDWNNQSARLATTRLRSGSTKQPLALDLSFGNSPSAVRQFGRVSDKSPRDAASQVSSPTDENANPKARNNKEALLGKRAYGRAVGLACQEVLSTTGGQDRRGAVSHLAEAFSDLEIADPEGLYHIIRVMNEKLQG